MMIFSRKNVILTLFSFLFIQSYSQRMEYEVNSATTIFLKAVYNEDPNSNIKVIVDGKSAGTIAAGGSLAINRECHRFVKTEHPINGTTELWRTGNTTAEWEKKHPQKVKEEKVVEENIVSESPETFTETERERSVAPKVSRKNVQPASKIISIFKDELEKDPFYSSTFVQTLNEEAGKHAELMNYLKDKETRDKYIQEHQLSNYFNEKDALISEKEDNMDSYIGNFLTSNFNADELPDRSEYENRLRNILEEKIAERKDVLDKLRTEILDEDSPATTAQKLFSGKSIVINVVIGIIIIGLIILIISIIRRHNKKKKPTIIPGDGVRQNAKADIVVRRKTTSILKKQSLEDISHNKAYLRIDSSDFCSDSAVSRIYLKNTCIKDIYNLYAEDLRNPENPNEDGCMVLGRWIHNDESDEYYVSLEEIVKPGDDAIFKEYELNFGGKIKLKVSERLKRLRRETNLQYDMTCWVHSHPGLGVFFSNADSSVQMQLKHPTHPKFLVAIVIDILTPNQELGIFTFKHDMTINSKTELKKMYSLEELYKWAVESDRTSFKHDDHRNIMQTAQKRIDSHHGIELSNGSIIDMCQLQTSQDSGLLAWAYGYACEKNGKTEYVVRAVSQSKHAIDNEQIGCYINGSHCSIPTIRRIIANNINNVRFILFYSSADDLLTSIPVIDGQVSVEESYYGEEKLEDLKIWTRRKR